MKTLILLTSLALLITTGCRAARLSESFQPSPPISSEPYLEMLGVTTAREGRPLGGRSRIGPGFLVFIPLFPYGPQQFTPERFWSNYHNLKYDFLEDVSRTVIKDIQESGLVEHATLLPQNQSWNKWKLELRLDEGIWRRNITTYGLSIGGFYLWLFGAPASYGRAEISINAKLVDSNGNFVDERTFTGKNRVTEWIYTTNIAFSNSLPIAYDHLSHELRPWLAEALRNNVKSSE